MRIRNVGMVGVTVLGLLSLLPSRAGAEEPFPEALQQVAGMPCVPSCVVCHGVDPGTRQTFAARRLGATASSFNGKLVRKGDTDTLKANLAAYRATAATDPEAKRVFDQLAAGIDPETNVDLCAEGVRYGCGAHVVGKAPAREPWSALGLLGALLVVGGLVRRRRASNAD